MRVDAPGFRPIDSCRCSATEYCNRASAPLVAGRGVFLRRGSDLQRDCRNGPRVALAPVEIERQWKDARLGCLPGKVVNDRRVIISGMMVF